MNATIERFKKDVSFVSVKLPHLSMGRLRLCDVNEHSKPSVEWWTSK